MTVKIKTISGKELEIDISSLTNFFDLKCAIEELEHIPPQQQKLIYNGRILVDDKAELAKFNFQNGNVIHMVIALRGG